MNGVINLTRELLCFWDVCMAIVLDGIPVRTINLEGLLRTKQTMRDKDIADRIVLERALTAYRAQVQ